MTFSSPTLYSWGLPTCSHSFLVNIQYRRLYQSMNSQYLKLLATQVSRGSTAGSPPTAPGPQSSMARQGDRKLKLQEVKSLAQGPVVGRVSM